MAKIPFFLVTGFLGSGKTTLLKRYLVQYADQRRIAVVQNEFAETNIDSLELKRTGKSFEVLEMNNGSVFCVCLLGDFIYALNQFILKHHPDVIILEASGLSDPVSVSQLLSAPALRNLVYLAHIYTVVDAFNCEKTLQRIRTNRQQILTADTIILNKSDLIENTSVIEGILKKINPFAEIIKTSWCDISFQERLNFRSPVSLDKQEPPSGRPDISSAVIKTTRIIPDVNLKSFVDQWALRTYRMKGYVKTTAGAVSLQTSFDQIQYFDLSSYEEPTQIVILGTDLDNKALQKEFEDLCILK